jgi:hypothetical protein
MNTYLDQLWAQGEACNIILASQYFKEEITREIKNRILVDVLGKNGEELRNLINEHLNDPRQKVLELLIQNKHLQKDIEEDVHKFCV